MRCCSGGFQQDGEVRLQPLRPSLPGQRNKSWAVVRVWRPQGRLPSACSNAFVDGIESKRDAAGILVSRQSRHFSEARFLFAVTHRAKVWSPIHKRRRVAGMKAEVGGSSSSGEHGTASHH